MRITPQLARTTTLVLAAALLPALAPTPAAAQGKGHKYGHDKQKADHGKWKDRDDEGDDRRVADPSDEGDGYYRVRQPGRQDRVPPGQMPPSGMCRIWIDGVPPGRQPAPTDCPTAERNRPANARVIYGSSSSGEVYRNRRERTTGRTLPGGTWPYLSDALAFARGTRMSSVATLVPGARNVRLSPRTVNGVPIEALFYDSKGQLLERWRDTNGDGRADRITEYRNGQVINEYAP